MGNTYHVVAPQAWELAACSGAGLTLSQLRFFVSFMLSVAVGAIFRFMPTPRCESTCRLVAPLTIDSAECRPRCRYARRTFALAPRRPLPSLPLQHATFSASSPAWPSSFIPLAAAWCTRLCRQR